MKNQVDTTKSIPLVAPKAKKTLTLTLTVVIGLYIMAALRTSANPIRILEGLPHIFSFVFDDLIPPNWGYYNRVFERLLETWNIAFLSTTLAAIFCLPFTFLAASNINQNKYLYYSVRLLLNILRTIPDMIYAVVFVAILGLGPLAGVMALFMFSFGILVKLMSEIVEVIDKGPLEAIRATGGNVFQVIWYGAIPQILPQFVSSTLYVLEINIRASLILGYVGAGGIGVVLRRQLALFNYENVSMILFITLIAVVTIDFISYQIRKRLV
ncbi:phosphonate ABC transporter, permease protein PhnE [Serpentinicella sp. ANB-PHB4]|uniref:phosphonate ABC transporter, permease protein PhnE n=1 Tax=Serpentinicella sp. ANB-PHB4 TaxID=3074076 RepID=UPI00285F2867|nr:phosphonate ABC transporter, permease protein PhnE [Serpentinicella sp. ANB-PHB4]MDR5659737.1 phosphonate ABC transporter, permease protein PhnE [Serpentinicella sp. ANB-PHB4]